MEELLKHQEQTIMRLEETIYKKDRQIAELQDIVLHLAKELMQYGKRE